MRADALVESIYSRLDYVPVCDVQFVGGMRNMTQLRAWMGECEYHHAQCRRAFDGTYLAIADVADLPTRVIHITSEPNPQGSHCIFAKLLVTKGQKGRYLTLSHRWNKHGQQLRALKENIGDLERTIPNNMSRTLLHAIHMTRALGFEYLWVDTVCIIQDDKEDRTREIRKMADIFENATCMLAAVDTVHPDGSDSGLFQRSIPGPPPVLINMPCGPAYEETEGEPGMTKTVEPWTDVIGLKIANPGGRYIVDRSEWRTRAWITQERMLSRRTIYFTKYKTFWDCRQACWEEDRPPLPDALAHRNLSQQFHRLPDEHTNLEEQTKAWSEWNSIMGDYSRCLLTHEEDKEDAVAALWQRFQRRTGFAINRGIPLRVRDQPTSRGLLWITEQALKRYRRFSAPTWSWLCVNGPVTGESAWSHALVSARYDLTRDLQALGNDRLQVKVRLILGSLGSKVASLELKTYDEYIPIMGSAIYEQGFKIPDGSEPVPLSAVVPTPRLPPHARVLKKSRSGAIIGWAALDVEPSDVTEVLCAAIQRKDLVFDRELRTMFAKDKTRPTMDGRDVHETHIDVILLGCLATTLFDANLPSYQRLGCGVVVVAQDWLGQRDLEEVIIV